MTNRQTKLKLKKKQMHSFGCHVERLSRLRIHCTISTENKSTIVFDKLREHLNKKKTKQNRSVTLVDCAYL
jgi:hypothetical protein